MTLCHCQLVLMLQRITVPPSSSASSSRQPLTHKDIGTTQPKTQRKIAKDLSVGNMGFRLRGPSRRPAVTSGDGPYKCIQTLTLPILGLNHQQTTDDISHTWRGLRSAVRGSDLWRTCLMTPQTLSQTA